MADVVVIPGRMFGPAAGMLMYAGAVAERRKATVHRHWWSEDPPHAFGPEAGGWVRGEVTPLLDAVGGQPLLVGKSLATNAAVLAAERAMPAVWLTSGDRTQRRQFDPASATRILAASSARPSGEYFRMPFSAINAWYCCCS